MLKLFIHTEEPSTKDKSSNAKYIHYHPNVNHHHVNTHHEVYEKMKIATINYCFNNKNSMVFVPCLINDESKHQITSNHALIDFTNLANNNDRLHGKNVMPISRESEKEISDLFMCLNDMKHLSLVSIKKIKLFIENYNRFVYETNSKLCHIIPIEHVEEVIENYYRSDSIDTKYYSLIMSIVMLFQRYCPIRIGILDGLHRNYMLLEKDVINLNSDVNCKNQKVNRKLFNYTVEHNNVILLKWNNSDSIHENINRYQVYSSSIVKDNENIIRTTDWDIIEQFPRLIHELCPYHTINHMFVENGPGCRTWKQNQDLTFPTQNLDITYEQPKYLQTIWKSHIQRYRTSLCIKIFNEFVSYFNMKSIEKSTVFDLCDTKTHNQLGQEIQLEKITSWALFSGLENPNVTSLTQHLLSQSNKYDPDKATKLTHFKYFFKSCKEEMTHNKKTKDGTRIHFGICCLVNFIVNMFTLESSFDRYYRIISTFQKKRSMEGYVSSKIPTHIKPHRKQIDIHTISKFIQYIYMIISYHEHMPKEVPSSFML